VGPGWFKVQFALPSVCRGTFATIGRVWHVKVDHVMYQAMTTPSAWIHFREVRCMEGQWREGKMHTLFLSGIPLAGHAPSVLVDVICGNSVFRDYAAAVNLCVEDQRTLGWGLAARLCYVP
jgi:hypothetical protein